MCICRQIPHLQNPVNKHFLDVLAVSCPVSSYLCSKEMPSFNLNPYKAKTHSDLRRIRVTCHPKKLKRLKWRSERGWVFYSSYVHVRPCGGRANRGVAVSRPGLLGGPHASLHPCRMCRWWACLTQNRPGEPQPREPGRPQYDRQNAA